MIAAYEDIHPSCSTNEELSCFSMQGGIHTYFRRCVSTTPKDTYDAVVIGGGHNGLTAAAYLARAGKRVCVLERREGLGGAAITEEIIPGFKFSRASYLLSLLRPTVIKDLNLKLYKNNFDIRRNMDCDTTFETLTRSLPFGTQRTVCSLDTMFPKYEEFIERIVHPLESLMDEVPINVHQSSKWELLRKSWPLLRRVQQMGISNVVDFYELMTAPIAKVYYTIMNRWFESDVLKATIGTDGVIGFAASPYDAGTGYVLLHHVLGGVDDRSGAWAYVMGGMGAVSKAIAKSASTHGAEIFVEQVCFTTIIYA
ncbi:hypothetical protein ANCDUO_00859 [Ancylostoma duodenale]|uniref:FAD dependent oxidoreductase n=1 Tax=Ancylostoma duodenale TaxID=51022 RepID=A0A0C2HGQ3_9BILA|nr:hypothetical protein ANCDUO_00859 [Ancylostoma duodenale]